jgi:predicted  nucleic acid-binding Zn-ribbon protein
MVFCANCGTEISEILKFCPSCGSPNNNVEDDENIDSNDQRNNVDHKQAKKDRYNDLRTRVEKYKPMWDKDGVIQFKSDHVAILQRKLGMQVEFIIAFEDLTKEGYELKAVDEGTESSYSKGVNSFYYFQKFKD